MKFASFLLFSSAVAGSSAFSVPPKHAPLIISTTTALSASSDNSDASFPQQQQKIMNKWLATGLVTASLWAAPAMVQNNNFHLPNGDSGIFQSSAVANAKQMASASGSRVNKDPESLLRYGLPINSKEVRNETKRNERMVGRYRMGGDVCRFGSS